jgi:putative SOS response-associated peptidase YedK
MRGKRSRQANPPLTEPAEIELWMNGEWKDARALQRPFPAERMMLLPVEQAALL